MAGMSHCCYKGSIFFKVKCFSIFADGHPIVHRCYARKAPGNELFDFGQSIIFKTNEKIVRSMSKYFSDPF